MPLPPGPRAPRPIITVRWIASPLKLFEQCAERYGDFFTLRLAGFEPMVFTSDPASIRKVFAGDRDNVLPPGRSFVLGPLTGTRSVLVQEGEEHLSRRKLMLPAFHGDRMRAYEELIESLAIAEVERWPVGTSVRLHSRFQALTLEVILSAVFGLGEGERRELLRERLARVLDMTSSRRMMAAGLFTRRLGRFGPYRIFERQVERIDELLAAEIAERRQDPAAGSRDDILSMLIAARFDDGSAMADGEIRDQLMTLLVAGHETTATALAWTFDLLLHTPGAMKSLREAVDDGDREYVDAVGKEALRLRPVIPMLGRRLGADAELGPWKLPAGTDIFPAIQLVQLREDVYPDPHSFRPERFLDGDLESFAWIPFGGGTRRCLGAAFAQFEMRIVLSVVLSRVELRAADPEPERPVRRNVTLSPRHGTRAVLVSRRPTASKRAPVGAAAG
jgi:cytochrome P450